MSNIFTGEIMVFGGNFTVQGYTRCDGQLLPISQNQALFSLLGTSFGGDGQTTFGVPDLRSRVPISQGTGRGLSPRNLGEQGGAESVTLTKASMPSHSHTLNVQTGNATAQSPAGNMLATPSATANGLLYLAGNATGSISSFNPAPDTVGASGGSQPHPNIQPVLAMNYLIATTGIYPARS